jgi:hypothetical protein
MKKIFKAIQENPMMALLGPPAVIVIWTMAVLFPILAYQDIKNQRGFTGSMSRRVCP